MTLQFFKEEDGRLLKALSETDPASPEYKAILNNLEDLSVHVLRTIDVEERLRYDEANAVADGFTTTPSGNVIRMVQPQPKPIEPDEIEPVATPDEPEPASDEPKPVIEDAKPLTFDEVKAAFTAAARSGVKVGEIINDAGYTKLSEVPESKYAALMTELEKKQNGEE